MKVVNLSGATSISKSADVQEPPANRSAVRMIAQAMIAFDAVGEAQASETK